MAVKLKVTLKGFTETGDKSKYDQDFLIYDDFKLSPNDPVIERCIKETSENTNMQIDDIIIKANLQVS